MPNHEKQLEDLARMTQDQFAALHEDLDRRFGTVGARLSAIEGRLESLAEGQRQLLTAVFEIPSKRTFARLVGKLEDHEDRLADLEQAKRDAR